ncbi:MAG: 4Fe-4S binding protein [Dehalococcoidia bacterium]|nr:4Fe-4S binding protein [Dehalococcoidia bacterium]
MILVDEEKCTLCGACVEACPWQSISLAEGRLTIDRDLCAECGACLPVCPTGAIYEVEVAPAAARETAAAPVLRARSPVATRSRSAAIRPATAFPIPRPSPLWVGFLPLAARFVGGLAGWWLDRRRPATRDPRDTQAVRRSYQRRVPPVIVPMGPLGLRRRWRGGRGR